VRLRSEQVEQLRTAKREESFERLLAELRTSSPQATAHLDDAELLAIMRQAADRAGSHGVTGAQATATYIKMAVFFGITFDEDPAVIKFLKAPGLDPDFKVSLLANLVSSKLTELK
jgi:hypothetical protein